MGVWLEVGCAAHCWGKAVQVVAGDCLEKQISLVVAGSVLQSGLKKVVSFHSHSKH